MIKAMSIKFLFAGVVKVISLAIFSFATGSVEMGLDTQMIFL